MATWTIGDLELTRVGDPGWSLELPQDERTAATLQASPWLAPAYVTDDWSLRVGSSAVVIRRGDDVVLVDPFLVFDDPALLGPRLQALRDAGVEAEDVVAVVNTHIDGIGINVLLDGSPTFPEARYLVPRIELEAQRAGIERADPRGAPLLALWDEGTVVATEGDEWVLDGVRLADAPGHNPGHHVVWIESGGEAAVVTGHLFLHPAQIARPEVDNGDLDPALLARTRRALLADCVERQALLIGPLFESPGGGRVAPDGDAWRLVPA